MTNLPATRLTPIRLGQLANQAAESAIFDLYNQGLSQNTQESQVDALAMFAAYLADKGWRTTGPRLSTDPAAWRGATWGLVEGFKQWMLAQGYAVGTINHRLSTVRTYAGLAAKARAITSDEAALIASVGNIGSAAGQNIDDRREQTRIGAKKADFITLTRDEVDALLDQPPTPRGRRDAALVAMLYFFGCRAGEAAGLQVSDVNLQAGLVHVFRPKVKGTVMKHGVYDLHQPEFAPARRAFEDYSRNDAPPIGLYFRGSVQNTDALGDHAMTRVTISQTIAILGERIGIDGLSAHDLRHTGATHIAESDDNLVRLRDWGGWNSIHMPARYAQRAAKANAGITFGGQ